MIIIFEFYSNSLNSWNNHKWVNMADLDFYDEDYDDSFNKGFIGIPKKSSSI